MSTSRRKQKQEPAPAGQSGQPQAGQSDAELLSNSPFDDDLEAELAQPPRTGLSGLTLYLGAAVILLVGFVGGIEANKTWGGGDGGSPAAASRPGGATPGQAGRPDQGGRFGGQGQGGQGQGGQGQGGQGQGGQGFGGRTGQGRQGFGGGNFTVGTVQKIDGSTIYLQTQNGVVKVSTSGSTSVQVTKSGSVKDLKSGASIVVRGTAGQDGTVAATSVNQGGSAFGGVGRFGGGQRGQTPQGG